MSGIYGISERLMSMDTATWERHANPWSVYTRFTVLPLLVLAIWSRTWLGWGALLPIVLACGWAWINPRAFGPPERLDGWASKGVLGERVFLTRRAEVAAHHRAWADGLAWASLPGAVVLALGLWWLEPWWTVFGIGLAVVPKVWFVDRMVWLYEDWLRETGKDLGDV